MSMRALLLAVETRIRTALSLDATKVGVQLDGQPPPSAGQVYYGIHGGGWTNTDGDLLSRDRTHDLSVTITMRTDVVPADRVRDEILLKAGTGLYDRADTLANLLHGDSGVLTAANATLGGSVNGFVQPLRATRAANPQVRGPDWFWSEASERAPTGVSITVDFDFARQVQKIAEDEE